MCCVSQEVIVQIDQEGAATKGAALTNIGQRVSYLLGSYPTTRAGGAFLLHNSRRRSLELKRSWQALELPRKA